MHRIILFMILLFWSIFSIAQCPSGNVNLTNQATVDNFVATYPTCTSISGNLIIGTPFSSDIINLSGLSNINTVSNNLIVWYCDNLISLAGLENISTVQNQININSNPSLSNIDGLAGITSVGVQITIENNDALTDVSTFDNLNSINGSISIRQNDDLASISGFSNLASINSSLIIDENPVLTSVSGFSSLNTVIGLFIEDNTLLNNLVGLNNISNMAELVIDNNDALTGLGSFGTNLSNLSNLSVARNASLIDMSALNNLNAITADLTIDDNGMFNSLSFLQNINTVGGTIIVTDNPNLAVCETESICDHLTNSGPITISGNASGCASTAEVQTACALLPIELIEFFGEITEQSIALHWTTAMEFNNQFFEVQHKTPNTNFQPISKVSAKGDSSADVEYNFQHTSPSKGSNYYRLKQVDFDGKFSFSSTIAIDFRSASISNIFVFPNPVRDIIFVESEDDELQRVEILDARTGQLMKRIEQKEIIGKRLGINVEELPVGVYLIRVVVDEMPYFQRIVIQK